MVMNKKNLLPVIILVLSFLAFVSLSGCQHSQRVRSPTEKHYDLKGKVVTVEKDKRLVTVAHEDIKDYMPGMTMPFSVRDDWAFGVLMPGDQITATLVVDGTQSWLEDLVITKESADTNSP